MCKLFTEIGEDVGLPNIDIVHRLAPRRQSQQAIPTRPRDILIKFVTYRARKKVYTKRRDLKNSTSFKGAFLNEELTKKRSEVFYHA